MSNQQIFLLSQPLINQIAAGEIIDRPAAIIKELVENSIDANASNIKIYLQNSGKTTIIVEDDGDGIQYNDLKLAIATHATSKLQYQTLDKITTLGFRGEGLASINAVSHLEISSITQQQTMGYKLYSNDIIVPDPIKYGTIVKVSNLFYNTPARQKFLKSDTAEANLCYKIIKQLALANPSISFSITHNNKKIFTYTATPFFEKRIQDVLGQSFYDNAIFIDNTNIMFNINGMLALPTFNNKDIQHIIINNRIIKDNKLKMVIKVAYNDVLFGNLQPSYCLHITINPTEIDVNSHPNKTEVRFQHTKEFNSLLISAIKNHLSSPQHQQTSTTFSNQLLQQAFDHNKANNTHTKKNINSRSPNTSRPNNNYLADNFKVFAPHITNSHTATNNSDDNLNTHQILSTQDKIHHPLGQAIAQIHGNWLITQTSKSLIIVDQHAAHERVNEEKLQQYYQQHQIVTQNLLGTEMLTLEQDDIEYLEQHQDTLKNLGITYSTFGQNGVIIHTIPALLSQCNIAKLINDILTTIKNTDAENINLNHYQDAIIKKMACHQSVRYNDKLNLDEINELLRQMEETPNYAECSHGRPTYIEIKIDDIAKMFKKK